MKNPFLPVWSEIVWEEEVELLLTLGYSLGYKKNNLLIHVMHRYCAVFMASSFATTVKPLSGEVKHYLITVQYSATYILLLHA